MTLDPALVSDLVTRALAEDAGSGDVTTQATVPEGARAAATITLKAPGVLFGLDVAEEVFRQAGDGVQVERLAAEGTWLEAGTPVLRVTGPAAAILRASAPR